jgi:hypothetical protein
MSDSANNGRTYMRAEELLPAQHLAKLNRGARRTYATIWNCLNNRTTPEIWLYTAQVAERSRVSESLLPMIHDELIAAGLVHVTPGRVQTRYRILDPDEVPGAEV